MEIITNNVWTELRGYYPEKAIRQLTSYLQPGYWFSEKYKRGYWDGRIHLSKKRKNSLLVPTGFLARLTEKLDEMNWHYTLYDNRELMTPDPIYELHDNEFNTISLKDKRYSFQAFAVDQALTRGRGIIKIATGGGKTELGAALIKAYNLPTIWLTHRGSLAEQTRARLEERLQEDVGIFGYGHSKVTKTTVLMVQSSREYGASDRPKLTKLINECQLVIGDEIHHLQSDEWYNVFENIQAPYRFGLTATPKLKGPGLALLAMTGDLLVDIPAWDLIERLALVPPRIWWITITEPTLDSNISWQTAYKLGITQNSYRNHWITDAAKTFRDEDKPTLILVQRINHGHELKRILNKAEIKTEFLSGKDSIEYRNKTMLELKRGELDCVAGQATAGFGEGADFPFLKAIINATGFSGGGDGSQDEEAGHVVKQILGRGLRRYPGKLHVDYVDFIDKTHRFLSRASNDRYNTLKAEGYEHMMQRWINYEQEIVLNKT
jgi:superfamily II DNA or RNA helicase